MRVGLFAARKPARGACSVVSVRVVVARCCAVFAAVIFCCYRGCAPGWLRGAFSCRVDCESWLVVVCVSMSTIKGACCRAGRSTRAGLERRSRTGGEAQTVLDRYHEAVGAEPRITGDLQALGLNLWNLQFRVKSASGTVDKVLNRGKRFDALYDVIRYTSVSGVGDYYEDFNRTIRTLTAKGYQVVEVTDFWKLTEESRAKGGYKGINVKMDSPDGAHFELQFHTPESLRAKESVHVLYERLRRSDVTAAEREEVCRAMDATFSGLEVPVDVLTARR